MNEPIQPCDREAIKVQLELMTGHKACSYDKCTDEQLEQELHKAYDRRGLYE